MNHVIDVPDKLWADFINVLFAADRRIVRTPENEDVMMFIKEVIFNAFNKGDVLIVDGKIIPKDFNP